MQVIKSPKVYPVIVIGSGAAGGMAAWNLTQKGVQVLILDAGDKFDRGKFWTHVRPWEARERRAKPKPDTAAAKPPKPSPKPTTKAIQAKPSKPRPAKPVKGGRR